jgi:hypothetical protein
LGLEKLTQDRRSPLVEKKESRAIAICCLVFEGMASALYCKNIPYKKSDLADLELRISIALLEKKQYAAFFAITKKCNRL